MKSLSQYSFSGKILNALLKFYLNSFDSFIS